MEISSTNKSQLPSQQQQQQRQQSQQHRLSAVYSNDGVSLSTDSLGQQREKRITNFQASMHILKTAIGTGVLAMPQVVRDSGLLMGTCGILLVSVLVIHSSSLLVESAQFVRRYYTLTHHNLHLDYARTFRKAVGLTPPWFRRHKAWLCCLLQFFILFGQFGFLAVCNLFVAQNLRDVLVYHWPTWSTVPLTVFELGAYVLFVALVFIKTLRWMAVMSAVANVMGCGSLGITLLYSVTHMQAVVKMPLAKSAWSLPVLFGVVVYAFEVITVLVPVEDNMRNRRDLPGWNGLLGVSLLMATAMYTGLGFYGYLCFGEAVQPAVIYSMPMTPWYWMISKPMYVFAVFCSYAIQFYVLFHILWKSHLLRRLHNFAWGDALLRLVLVTGAFLLAALVPKVHLLIALIGASSCSAMTLVYPPLIHTCTVFANHTQRSSKWKWCIVAKNMLITLLGVVGVFIGGFISISDIIKAY